MTAAPVIGVTTSRKRNRNGYYQLYVLEAYVQALAQMGAAPVLIPLGLDSERIQGIISHLDGVLFTGGGDIHPVHYDESNHSSLDEVDDDRDRVEIRLFKSVIENRMPFLGICRGLQLVNVAMGGTLYTDIAEQLPGSLQHSFEKGKPRSYLAHTVQIEKQSCLAAILGTGSVQVNSMHHQGIRKLAPGLEVSALASDGLVEAVELRGHPFGLAVQWHPEWLLDQAGMRSLFRKFIEKAGREI